MTKAQKKESIQLYGWIALAWFLLWEFSILVTNPSTFFQRTVNELWRDAYLVTLNFFFFEYVVTYIFGKRPGIFSRILLGIFLAWIMLMLYSFGLFTWRLFGIGLGIYKSFLADASVSHALAVQMQASVASVFFFGIIRHIYYYRKLKETAQKLRIENQEAELNFLKSQTNPHFLFNTLNNIYSLARDKSDLAPESILRLSKILRFMLYEAGGEYITIEQEVAIINDYIALEKLRYDESLQVNFNYNMEESKQALPPLLLMPLVENAFKHGVSETRKNPFISIRLSVAQRQLAFSVINSTDTVARETHVREKIGLANLRRQLELLYRDYHLSVQQEDTQFTAILKINLASHV